MGKAITQTVSPNKRNMKEIELNPSFQHLLALTILKKIIVGDNEKTSVSL